MSTNVNIPAEKEQRIVETMILMYCRAHHGKNAAPCLDCAHLIEYSQKRSADCPRRPNKPFCSACPTHCYEPDMQEHIREVMRYSGPRMIYKHPLMAISHLRNGMRSKESSD